MLISKTTRKPRLSTLDVSVCHTGAVDVLIPLPILRRVGRGQCLSLYMEGERGLSAPTHPVTMRPTIMCGTLKEVVCRIAPIVMMVVPMTMVFLRPYRSPTVKAAAAPRKQPMV